MQKPAQEQSPVLPRLVPISVALAHIPVGRGPFYQKIKEGKLPSYHFGRKILVDVDEVLAAMRQVGEK